MSTLSNVGVGDKVAVVSFHWHRTIEGIYVVTRTTAKLVEADGQKWNRETGRKWGGSSALIRIILATEEIKKEYAEQERVKKRDNLLAPKLNRWTSLPNDVLDKIAAALGIQEEK